jgi:hypothetical protein
VPKLPDVIEVPEPIVDTSNVLIELDTTMLPSFEPETLSVDTLVVDTLPADTLPPDTVPPDTLRPDTMRALHPRGHQQFPR